MKKALALIIFCSEILFSKAESADCENIVLSSDISDAEILSTEAGKLSLNL